MATRRIEQHGKGIWIDGLPNELEWKKWQTLLRMTMESAALELPMDYEDEKIYWHAKPDGKSYSVHYGWKFPPKEYHQAPKDTRECCKCRANPDGTVNREVWCQHPLYGMLRCPFGVATPQKCCPVDPEALTPPAA